eukprot:5432646-Alexandrium_andersonii.AAC.1
MLKCPKLTTLALSQSDAAGLRLPEPNDSIVVLHRAQCRIDASGTERTASAGSGMLSCQGRAETSCATVSYTHLTLPTICSV